MPTFVGLDLAWSAGRASGVCWLVGEDRDDLRCVRLEAAVLETVALADAIAAGRPAVVTIDAPVLYTPERWAEREIARRFGRYKASAHSAHRAVREGYTAGIELGRALAARGFELDPGGLLEGDRRRRWAVEIYPHTLHVRLFGLDERIRYKRGRVAQRRLGLQAYQSHLRALLEREAPRVLEDAEVQGLLDVERAAVARGASLKRLDDTLDGLVCALGAWLLWRDPAGWEMIGDQNGYIVAPRAAGGAA